MCLKSQFKWVDTLRIVFSVKQATLVNFILFLLKKVYSVANHVFYNEGGGGGGGWGR